MNITSQHLPTLENNYVLWKEDVIDGKFLFLFESQYKDVSPPFISKLLNETMLCPSVYYVLIDYACSFFRNDFIEIFLKHPPMRASNADDTISAENANIGYRIYICRKIISASTKPVMDDKYYPFGKGVEAIKRCIAFLLDVDDPKRVLYYKGGHPGNLLFLAITEGVHPEIYSLLIDYGIDPYEKYKITLYNGYTRTHTISRTTAIDLARKRCSPEETKAFFENYTRKNYDLFTLLFNKLF